MNYPASQSSRLHSFLQRSKRHKWINNVHCSSTLESELHQPLSPDVSPDSPALRNQQDVTTQTRSVKTVGNYLILDKIDSNLTSPESYKAVNILTQKTYLCKVTSIDEYRSTLEPYLRAGNHENINEVQEVILGDSKAYFFFLENYGDLHTYVRDARRLKEPVAATLFSQIASAVKHCHDNGIVIRDLKLRKFVFKNRERTKLMLEGFEDSIVLSEAEDDDYDDSLTDKHGCPVYVSPEILQNANHYSGFLADIWSLGIILYTMIMGCYPFHDTNINTLFLLIRQGHYHIPSAVSSAAKCLLKNILRMNPEERLQTDEILIHPWFKYCAARSSRTWLAEVKDDSYLVPDTEYDLNTEMILC